MAELELPGYPLDAWLTLRDRDGPIFRPVDRHGLSAPKAFQGGTTGACAAAGSFLYNKPALVFDTARLLTGTYEYSVDVITSVAKRTLPPIVEDLPAEIEEIFSGSRPIAGQSPKPPIKPKLPFN